MPIAGKGRKYKGSDGMAERIKIGFILLNLKF